VRYWFVGWRVAVISSREKAKDWARGFVHFSVGLAMKMMIAGASGVHSGGNKDAWH
jgi:hypothetical protein